MNRLKPEWAKWEKVLVCRHPLIVNIWHMGGVSLSGGETREFFKIATKDGHTKEFNSLAEVNNYLNMIDDEIKKQTTT